MSRSLRSRCARPRRWLAAGLLVGALPACTTAIEHGLDERAANEVVATLERRGIAVKKLPESGGAAPAFTLEVSDGDVLRALDALRETGLPRDPRLGLAEVYGKPSLIPSATEERARFLRALTADLERTLEAVEGVAEAHVHVVLPARESWARWSAESGAATASVLLKQKPGATAVNAADVQKLVAGGVPGLQPAAVTVLLSAGAVAAQTSEAPLANLGPLRVAPGSRAPLLVGIAAALLAIASLAGLLLWSARRVAGLERRLRELTGREPTDDIT